MENIQKRKYQPFRTSFQSVRIFYTTLETSSSFIWIIFCLFQKHLNYIRISNVARFIACYILLLNLMQYLSVNLIADCWASACRAFFHIIGIDTCTMAFDSIHYSHLFFIVAHPFLTVNFQHIQYSSLNIRNTHTKMLRFQSIFFFGGHSSFFTALKFVKMEEKP